MNLAALLDRAARTGPERAAAASGRQVVQTYGELARNACGLGHALRVRHGLQTGDRVVLLATNCPEYIECLFACWRAGLIAVPVNAKLHPQEVAYVLSNSGARAAFVSADLTTALHEATRTAGTTVSVIEIGSNEYRALQNEPAGAIVPVGRSDPAWLFYTSGTTGRPKGATLTHGNLLTMAMNYFVDIDRIGENDCVLHAAPMSHGSGMYILPHVMAGALQVIPESDHFEAREIFELIDHYRGVSFFAAPTMVNRLVSAAGLHVRASGLKTIVYGGGPMHVADSRRALEYFGPKLVQIYGQGESPMTITVLPKSHHADDGSVAAEQRLGSAGFAQCPVEVKVIDPDGRDLPANEMGEVAVRGDTVMAGYWGNAEATAAAIVDGWLRTGDVGSFDTQGLLTLRDRAKDLIISGGTNIYPREVEEALLQHPLLAEVSVVGMPDTDWGEQVVACVVPKQGATQPTPEELDQLCLRTIARFKRPKRYVFFAELPKNNYGKILKTDLRRRLGQAES